MSWRAVLLGSAGLVLTAGAGLAASLALRPPETGAGATGEATIGGPFTLVSDAGNPVTEAVLRGRGAVVYFGYTYCPEVYPTALADLTRWIKALGPDAVAADPGAPAPRGRHGPAAPTLPIREVTP